MQKALTHLRGLPGFNNIEHEEPLRVGAGGTQSPFDEKSMRLSLKNRGRYICGGNLFWLDVIFNIAPGIPLQWSAIEHLIARYFSCPVGAHRIFVILVCDGQEGDGDHKGLVD